MPPVQQKPVRRAPPAQPSNALDPVKNILGKSQGPATSSDKEKSEGRYNFLTCLACAQKCNIDFTGISWITAQGNLGQGGEAVVSQTRASLDTVFAFRRRNKQRATDDAYREICSEILALGNADIQSHPNIVQLLAISWEIEDIAGWIWGRTLQVWPVLIMEKAHHKDLREFIENGDGKLLNVAGRIKMCADIASALAVVHKNNIIHGDIKPENVLVFEGTVAKLNDFGFSALASNRSIRLGGSVPWIAPEHDRGERYTLEQAKLTDLYSFGMLCLWVIFKEQLTEKGTQLPKRSMTVWSSLWSHFSDAISNTLSSYTNSVWTGSSSPDLQFLGEYNVKDPSKNMMRSQTLELVKAMDDSNTKIMLQQLFSKLLSYKPEDRTFVSGSKSDFEVVTRLLKGESYVSLDLYSPRRSLSQRRNSSAGHTHKNISGNGPQTTRFSTPFPAPSSFRVSQALQSLCLTDYRVRKHVYQCLEQEYRITKDTRKMSDLAIQISFCKKIGFGTTPDDHGATSFLNEARSLLRRSSHFEPIDDNYFLTEIELCEALQPASNKKIQALYSSGIIQPIHQAIEYRFAPPEMQAKMEEARKEEVRGMEKALGKTHGAILNLKWTLFTSLMENQDQIGPLKFFDKMVKDLQADHTRGPEHADTVITRAYRSIARMKLLTPQSLETSLEEDRGIYNTLVKIGLGSHVVTLMMCMHLSMCLQAQGHFREAAHYLELAKKPTIMIFGPQHGNTIQLDEQEGDRLVREGDSTGAARILKSTLSRMKNFVEADDMVLNRLRNKIIELLLATGELVEAENLIKEMEEDMRKIFSPQHPVFGMVLMPRALVALRSERFKEASDMALKLVKMGDMEPWPPKDHPNLSKPVDDAEVSKLLGLDTTQPASPYPDPLKLPKNPMLMSAEILYIVSLHAHVQSKRDIENAESTESAVKADTRLRKLMEQINKFLGPDEWQGISKTGGSAGSALRKAMDEGNTPLVEITASMGGQGLRNGLHYDKAIAISKKAKLSKMTVLLEEHQALCAYKPQAAPFPTARSLEAWIDGQWEGSYLWGSGGMRKDPKGLRSIKLKASRVDHRTESVSIKGTGTDDQGDWNIKGHAETLGTLTLRFFLKEGISSQGWEYKGHANLERKAIGGYWGFRNVDHDMSNGSFFFYKC